MTALDHWLSKNLTVALAAALALGVLLGVILQAAETRRLRLAAAETAMAELAQDTAVRLATQLQTAQALFSSTQAAGLIDRGAEDAALVSLFRSSLPWLTSVALVDASGQVLVADGPPPLPASSAATVASAGRLQIEPARIGADGAWLLPIRLAGETTLDHVLVASIDLQALFAALPPAAGGSSVMAVLYDQQGGALLAAYPFGKMAQSEGSLMRRMAAYLRLQEDVSGQVAARFRDDFLPGEGRVSGSALAIAVAVPRDAVLAGWISQSLLRVITVAVLGLLAVIWAWRHQQRQATDSALVPATAEMGRLRQVVEASQAAIEVVDLSGRRVFVNPAFEALFGPDTTTGADGLNDRWTPDSAQRWREDIRPLLQQGQSWEGTLTLLRRDGRPISVWIRADLVPPAPGHEPLILRIMHDFSAEQERARLLHEAKDSAEATSRAKSEFLASMSHELRTPLNAILGFAQLLQMELDQRLSGKQREHVDHILVAGRHLLSLIDEILNLSKVESGSVEVTLEPVLVMNVLDEAVTTLRPIADREHVQITVDNRTDPEAVVRADVGRLKQVLINLGSNGIKYNRPENAQLTIRVESLADSIRFSFIDTGIGIPKERMEELFEPFNRLGLEEGGIQGTGIGLTITKRLVELMHGKINATSEVGAGSHFWVDLPRASHQPAADPTTATPKVVRLSPSRPSRALEGGFSVLYIEDNPASRKLMREILAALPDVTFYECDNAHEGQRVAREKRPDVIIMDIGLPGIDGVTALRGLRRWPETHGIPVIALTAAALPGDVARGEAEGFLRYLTKPLDVRALFEALALAVDGNGAGSPGAESSRS